MYDIHTVYLVTIYIYIERERKSKKREKKGEREEKPVSQKKVAREIKNLQLNYLRTHIFIRANFRSLSFSLSGDSGFFFAILCAPLLCFFSG